MMRFKNCPRCKGDIQLDRDYYGWYEQCLQCGYMRDLPRVEQEQLTQEERERKLLGKQVEDGTSNG